MEEILYQSECIINGEKYITTITKVIEDTQDEELENEVIGTSDNTEEITFNGEAVITFNVSDIPDGMDIETWLSIVDKFGIILTK